MEHKIYNPANQPKEWLIQHFVVRTKVFERIFKDIKSNTMKYPAQHYLIQGQRGMGKTTLLLRLKYEIENTPELSNWLVPVFFNEEVYDLTSLPNLWEKLLKYLDNLWNTDGAYYKKTDEYIGNPDYEKKCYELLTSILHEKKKKLIIFFDNFGQLFLDNLKEKEQHRLREILMNCSDIRIIGASATVLYDVHDYSKPFFEFFKVINLEGLNKDETFQLISKLQENSDAKIDLKKNKAKIETLAILTTGVIRTIMLIYEVVLNDHDGSALRDLEVILDRITPLYKHRVEDLPAQQRKIVDVIAKSWDAISTKDIAQHIREDGQPMATKLISAQLQQLEKNNIVDKKQTNTKNHLYQLKERFFNIWYLMRNGDRMDRCRVVWLTKFLETWYSDENEFDSFIKEHIEHLKSGKYDPGAALTISEALAYSQKLNLMSLDLLLKETATILNDNQKKSLPNISKHKYEKAIKLYEESDFEGSISLLLSIDNRTNENNLLLVANYLRDGKLNLVAEILDNITSENQHILFLKGTAYVAVSEFKKAIEILKKYDGPLIGQANDFIGRSYFEIEDKDSAKKYILEAIKAGFYQAYDSLIKIYMEEDDLNHLEKYSMEAIKVGQLETVKFLSNRYSTANNTEKLALSETIIDKYIKIDKNDADSYFIKAKISFTRENFDDAYKFSTIAHSIFLKKGISSPSYHLNFSFMLSLLIYTRLDKEEAIALINSSESEPVDDIYILLKSFVEIWKSDYQKGFEIILNYFNEKSSEQILNRGFFINGIFELFLAKKQYHYLLKIFNAFHNLKDLFKPTYYALMYFLQDEYPNEYLKMGEELKQPVEDILKEVEEMSIKYA